MNKLILSWFASEGHKTEDFISLLSDMSGQEIADSFRKELAS